MLEVDIHKIPFIGLKNGIHEYEFNINKTFFTLFEQSLIGEADIQIHVELEKLTNMINLEFFLSGVTETICDRCGGDLESDIDGTFRVVVKFGDETSDLVDDVTVLGPSEHFILLDQLFYEFSHLCLGSKNVHETEDLCNQEALAALKKFELKEKETADPRWDILKNLK